MTLTILIVNWRSKDYVRKCLETVRETCIELKPRVIVVDGGSFDGCDSMLAAEFPEVLFVQSQENIGFGRCNNLGFEKVSTEAVLLLNPDTELRPGAVARLVEQLHARPDAGLVSPKLLNSDGSLQTSCVRAFPTPLNRAWDSDFLRRLFPNSRHWGVGRAFASRLPMEVEAVSGACMLLRSEVFRQVKGFSPQFFMYGEDMDLCFKIHRRGLKVIYVPDAEIVHHGSGSSSRQISATTLIRMREAWATYMRLNHGPFTVFQYRVLQMVSAIVRLACSLPGSVVLVGRRRASARMAVQKWWHILKWSLTSRFSTDGTIR